MKKINLQIEREELLKLKASNYEAYQLLNSLKLVEDLDRDYCETLDKHKLARECELGYFKIEDLFPKNQIISAYNNLNIERFVPLSDIVADKDIPGAYHIKYKPTRGYRLIREVEEESLREITLPIQSYMGVEYTIEPQSFIKSKWPSEIDMSLRCRLIKLLHEVNSNILSSIGVKVEPKDKKEVDEFLLDNGFTWRGIVNKECFFEKDVFLAINFIGGHGEEKVLSAGGLKFDFIYDLKTGIMTKGGK
jgi:hypothetical protein